MGRHMKVLAAGLLVVMAGASCTTQKAPVGEELRSKEAVLKYVESGYIKGYGTDRLFCDRFLFEKVSRTQVLLEYLGYGDIKWDYFEVSKDQRYLRFWQRSNRFLHIPTTRVLVLGRDVMPRILEFSESHPVLLDGDNTKTVQWINARPRWQYRFANGQTIRFPGDIRLDNTGEFFCCGGHYLDYETETMKESPMYIYSVHDPARPIMESALPYAPDIVFTTSERLYLAGGKCHGQGIMDWIVGRMPDDAVCEIYSRQDDGLKLMRRFTVHCPLHYAARRLRPIDLDERANVMLFELYKQTPWPLEYYVLDMESRKLTQVDSLVCGRPGFMDPELIRGIVENGGVRPKRGE